jgi:hypothetical protein
MHVVPSMIIGCIIIPEIYCNSGIALKDSFSINGYEMHAGTSAA